MALPVSELTSELPVAELLEQFGPIPAWRIRQYPAPGTATEADVIELEAREDRLCELVDGVLVEKTVGFYESYLAMALSHLLRCFLDEHNLGIITGPDGMLRLAPGLVRIPDVSFISWDRLPNREVPQVSIADVVPDLAVEVLSKGNTPAEMERQRSDYFAAGVRLVWYVDPATRTVRVYTGPEDCSVLTEADTLDGGSVLPEFTVSLQQLFTRPKQERPSR